MRRCPHGSCMGTERRSLLCGLDTADGTRYHLIVEKLPRGEWDWSVWRQNDGSRGIHTGTAGTVQEAMQAAERAASPG